MSTVSALGNIRVYSAVDALIHSLLDDDFGVRCSAALALGNIGDNKAERPLRLLLSDDHDSVRESASYALKSLKQT